MSRRLLESCIDWCALTAEFDFDGIEQPKTYPVVAIIKDGKVTQIVTETYVPLEDVRPKIEHSYCPECDGWQEDCTHGRYQGPYIDIMNGGRL